MNVIWGVQRLMPTIFILESHVLPHADLSQSVGMLRAGAYGMWKQVEIVQFKWLHCNMKLHDLNTLVEWLKHHFDIFIILYRSQLFCLDDHWVESVSMTMLFIHHFPTITDVTADWHVTIEWAMCHSHNCHAKCCWEQIKNEPEIYYSALQVVIAFINI